MIYSSNTSVESTSLISKEVAQDGRMFGPDLFYLLLLPCVFQATDVNTLHITPHVTYSCSIPTQ